MPTCEYCGEEFPKGGAYATHVQYCADRPESEDTAEESAGVAEASSPESSSGESGDGVVTEQSSSTPQTRSIPPTRESEAKSVAAEIRGSTAGESGDGESRLDSEPVSVPDQSSGKWLAAGVLVLFVVVVWILLRRRSGD